MIKEKLNRYVKTLNEIPNDQDKYAWLMLFGKKSMDMQKELKQKSLRYMVVKHARG